MIGFIDENKAHHNAQVSYKVKQGVNGEKSMSGTIYSNNDVLLGIDRGWRLVVDDEHYVITYAVPKDYGQTIETEFDAVHEFFYDFSHDVAYGALSDGSHTFKAYMDFIFADSGYTYENNTSASAMERQGFGNKSRLGLFNDVIKGAGVEFLVHGRVVRIVDRVGSDLTTKVEKNFNMQDLHIEKNINDFITYKRGYGAWVDEEDKSKGRLTVEYENPLASIYGRLHGEPIVDERYTVEGNLLDRLQADVENSYSVSVQLTMEDLTKSGYDYEQPRAGDWLMAINDDINFRQKVRIVSYESVYATDGALMEHRVVCNSIGAVQKLEAGSAGIKTQLDDLANRLEDTEREVLRVISNAGDTGRLFYGNVDPETSYELRAGDMWIDISGEATVIRHWNGYEWMLTVDTSALQNKLDDALDLIEDVGTNADKTAQEIDDALIGTGYIKLADLLASKMAEDDFETLFFQQSDAIGFTYSEAGIRKAIIAIIDGKPYLKGEHIILDGDTLVDGTFTVTGDMLADGAVIGQLEATGIDAQDVNIVNLNASSISGGNLELSNGLSITHNGKVIFGVNASNQIQMDEEIRDELKGADGTDGTDGADGAKGEQGVQGPQGPQGATGSQGPRGDTGTSVESITEYYLATSVSSGILSSNTGFTTAMQPMTTTNKYLWNYEKINFSDNTSQPTIPVIIGVYGDKGQTGSTGATGRSITAITEHYLATSANTGVTRSTDGWDTTMQPTTETNRYLWNYETITWSVAPLTTYVEPIIIGVHGAKGSQGIQGPKGATGSQGPQGNTGTSVESITEYYFATSVSSGILSTNAGFTTTMQPLTASNKYLWNYEKINFSDNTSQPTIPVIIGVYGDKGQTGGTGAIGATGRSIVSITEHYLATSASTGVTRSTDGWNTAMQPTTETNKYLWNYETITWSTAPLTTYVDPIIIGVHGAKGSQGIQGPKGATGSQGPQGNTGTSVESITEYYLATAVSSGIVSTNTGFTTTMQPLTATNKYLWNYEKVNFSDNTSQPTIPVIIGVYGDKGQTGGTGAVGATGRSIVSITEHYLATSASTGVTRSTAGWGTAMQPTTETNKYLWNYETINWSSGTTPTYVEPIIIGVHGAKGATGSQGIQGAKGATGSQGPQGNTGTSVVSITEYYLATSVSSGIVSSNAGFTTAMQPLTATNKYLWNYEKVNFSDNTSQPTIPVIIGVYGDKGQTGSTGATGRSIVSITEHYLATSASTAVTRTTAGWNTTMQPTTETNKYLWNYETINWSSGTTPTYVEPIIIGVHGAKGPQGTQGTQGIQGPKGATGSQGPTGATGTSVASITEYYFATSVSSGILSSNTGFTTAMQPMTATNKYLWNYEKVNFSDNTSQPTIPVIIGVYGDKGQTGSTGATGATGRSITAITEHYLATSASTGVTRTTAGWNTTMQPTTETNRYLWNYETITWSSGTLTTYVDPIIIGVHGAKGPQGIQGLKGTDGQSQWVHIRYSVNANGASMTTTPVATTKYIGVAITNSATAPAYTGFTWSKYVGENGAQGPQGVKGATGANGQPTYTWIKYADTPTTGMNDFPDGKKYIGMAFNKTTATESTTYSVYQWSLMPQNIEIGGRNLLLNSGELISNGTYNIATYTLSTPPIQGEQMTFTLKGTLATTKTHFGIYNSGGSVSFGSLAPKGNGLYSLTFNWNIGASANTFISVYAFTNAQVGVSEIEWAMLTRGNLHATDWTEAPEDTQAKIDEKADSTVTDAIQNELQEFVKVEGYEAEIGVINSALQDYKTQLEAGEISRDDAVTDIGKLLDRTAVIESDLGEFTQKWKFLDTTITMGTEGLLVGDNVANTGIRISAGRIDFLDNGAIVADITGQLLTIKRGIFATSATIGEHKIETIAGGHTIWSWIPS